MDLETILTILYIGAAIIAIGSGIIVAAMNNENHGHNDNRPELNPKEKKELEIWAKNQDNDAPF